MRKFYNATMLLVAFCYPAIAFGQSRCPEEDRHPGGESVARLWTGPLNGYYFQVG